MADQADTKHAMTLVAQTAWLAALMMSAGSALATTPAFKTIHNPAGEIVGRAEITPLSELEDIRIDESSGVAFSRREPDILWTHNDSGDGPFLYAFDLDGRARGFYRVDGAEAFDWEDIASFDLGGRPHLLIADFGDNRRIRDVYTLYIVEEPVTGAGLSHTGIVSVVMQIDFVYEDGRHDAEAIAVDPETGIIYIITKKHLNQLPCQLYRIERPSESTTKPLTAQAIRALDIPWVTAMDISRDGSRAVVITYDDAYEFKRAPGESWEDAFKKPWRKIPIPWRTQGEAICYGPDSDTLYLTSEKVPTPLWRVRIMQE